jgi:hypothetical protein
MPGVAIVTPRRRRCQRRIRVSQPLDCRAGMSVLTYGMDDEPSTPAPSVASERMEPRDEQGV